MVRVVTMLVVIFGLLLGGHVAIFCFVANSLMVAHPAAQLVLFVVLAGLTVSFPTSASLIHARPNAVTAALYVFAAIWMGLFVNLNLAIGCAWIVRELADLAGWALRRDVVAVATIASAVAVTALGAWRAFHPRLVHVDIELAGLPAAWQDKRVVQLSDIHLGFIHRRRFARRVVDTVRSADPDLVVITGDLVDGMGGDIPGLVRALDGLSAPRGVYFTSGNHEVYRGIGQVRRALAGTGISILDDAVVDLDGLRLIGIAFPGLRGAAGQELLARLRAAQADGGPSILLFHTPTDFDQLQANLVDQHVHTYWKPDLTCVRARELGIDLQLSGHTHAGQLFPFTLVADRIFGQHNFGLHREGDFQIYVSAGTGTWGPPLRTGSRSEITVFTLRGRAPSV